MAAETKEEIAAERDALREANNNLTHEVSRLRAQLGATGGRPGYQPQQQFVLSEGDRQELVMHGNANIGGQLRSRAEVTEMLGDNQSGVELGDGPVRKVPGGGERQGVYGVDYVYPSVEPGKIDPAVAGTPGINGPAADEPAADDVQDDSSR
jgi:hypothetical protein